MLLFAIGVSVFFVPFAFPSPPPIVRGFQSTRLFSPNDDGARDVARISFRMNEPGQADVSIMDVGGTRTWRTLTTGDQPAGIVRLSWDGRGDAGTPVADGQYVVSLRARSGRKQYKASRRMTLDRTPPPLGTVSVESAAIAGPGAGECRVAATALDRGSMALVAVPTDGKDVPVARLDRANVASGQTVLWDWDGRGADRKPVAAGLYLIRAALADRAKNTATRAATCWVGHAVGRAIPPAPRLGTKPRVRLTRLDGTSVPPGTRVTIEVVRRLGEPGGTSVAVVGPRVGARVSGPLQTTRVPLPRRIPVDRLWIVATTENARALIPLRP